MEKHFIEYMGNHYAARKLNLHDTRLKDGNYDGMIVATGKLRDATNAAFHHAEKNFDSDEYQNADKAVCNVFDFIDDDLLENHATDTEIVWYLLWKDYMEKDLDEFNLWDDIMDMATDEIRMWHSDGRTNVNMESYVTGEHYSVYAYIGNNQRNIYYGKSAKSACMAAIAFLSALSLQLNG